MATFANQQLTKKQQQVIESKEQAKRKAQTMDVDIDPEADTDIESENQDKDQDLQIVYQRCSSPPLKKRLVDLTKPTNYNERDRVRVAENTFIEMKKVKINKNRFNENQIII